MWLLSCFKHNTAMGACCAPGAHTLVGVLSMK
nr:MAG TPA: hypothetical protein [Caudoviricetes sp.]